MTKEQIKAYEEQLKPCPFCGKKPQIMNGALKCPSKYYVTCMHGSCNVHLWTFESENIENVVTWWNKRGAEEC